MSAQQTHRKKANHLQVGDILALTHRGDEVVHAALVTRVERISFQKTTLFFLVQPADDTKVIEVNYDVKPDLEVEVL